MKVPDNVTKTVGFVAYRNQQTGNTVPVGTMFFLGKDAAGDGQVSSQVFAVTARHVIDGLQSRGCHTCVLRLNPTDKRRNLVEIEIPISAWRFHASDESVDVAVVEQGIPQDVDHLVIPIGLGADSAKFSANEVDLGDEVFVSGLFVHHYGQRRNIPIVRVGSLAALNEEKVRTRSGYIDAYLVEARSIGGLSGSPVFVNLGASRMIGGQMKVHAGGPIYFLLGLVHGHFETQGNEQPPEVNGQTVAHELVNAGIAIVVPFEKIHETIRPLLR